MSHSCNAYSTVYCSHQQNKHQNKVKCNKHTCLTCIWSGWITRIPCWIKKREKLNPLWMFKLFLCVAQQKRRRWNTHKVTVHGGRLEGPPGALWRKHSCSSVCLWILPVHAWVRMAYFCFLLKFVNYNHKQKVAVYLLVEESPEHGQRDVEEQHLQHHLHLGNQEFLEPNTGKGIRILTSLSASIAFAWPCVRSLHLHRISHQPSPSSGFSLGIQQSDA